MCTEDDNELISALSHFFTMKLQHNKYGEFLVQDCSLQLKLQITESSQSLHHDKQSLFTSECTGRI